MDYHCKHCKANLDQGDIFDHFLKVYDGDKKKALETARMYGWKETDKKHFRRDIIVQPEGKPQYNICPDCNGKWPLSH